MRSVVSVLSFPVCFLNQLTFDLDFTAQRYASAVYAMALCLSVCFCVLSLVGVLLKWLNIGSQKQNHTIAQGV